jgi:hypothetical protein
LDGSTWAARWEEPTLQASGAELLRGRTWYTESLRAIAEGGDDRDVSFTVERKRPISNAVILNTVDFIYGHSMPFLLDGARLRSLPDGFGLVAIIQPFLRWMVPAWVDEIWTVGLGLSDGLKYFSRVSERIESELSRFSEVRLSHAYILPRRPVDIETFTGIARHDFSSEEERVTFIWREDPRRYWCSSTFTSRALRRLLRGPCTIRWQQAKVVRLLESLRRLRPDARFGVAGLGRSGAFPSWIEDHRVASFNEETERRLCRLYAASRLVIGVHGSHMLLPNLLAGMGISLMPKEKWLMFGQDLMPDEGTEAMALFSKRVLPVETPIALIATIATSMLAFRDGYWRRMADPFSAPPRSRKV